MKNHLKGNDMEDLNLARFRAVAVLANHALVGLVDAKVITTDTAVETLESAANCLRDDDLDMHRQIQVLINAHRRSL